MIRFDKFPSDKGYRLIVTPNRSLSWRHTVIFFVITCVLALIIGLVFSLQGMWLVLPFSGIEMMALGTALYITARKTHYREVITAIGDSVKIEKGIRNVKQNWVFERNWVRLVDETADVSAGYRKIALGSHGSYVEVGGFLSEMEKDELAFRLKGCIIRA